MFHVFWRSTDKAAFQRPRFQHKRFVCPGRDQRLAGRSACESADGTSWLAFATLLRSAPFSRPLISACVKPRRIQVEPWLLLPCVLFALSSFGLGAWLDWQGELSFEEFSSFLRALSSALRMPNGNQSQIGPPFGWHLEGNQKEPTMLEDPILRSTHE